jgi:hypothetical protein
VGLRENGWIEGKNLLVDYRYYEGHTAVDQSCASAMRDGGSAR